MRMRPWTIKLTHLVSIPGRDVAVIRQQRAEQQAQQQAMMAQAAQAQTTKDMSQIDTRNLGEVMQQLQGYGGMNG